MSLRSAQRSNPSPLYIVCSPFRGVGKTLIARLLTEFHAIDGRGVAAFDLADEGPQLADYLPRLTTVVDIGDTRGQMALFDRLIAGGGGATVIDLSHRAFRNFFGIAQDIGFFQEARRAAIEPLVLFIASLEPKSARIYGVLRRALTQASLLPVRNKIERRALHDGGTHPDAPKEAQMDALEIALLDFPLRARIDDKAFSFCELWRSASPDLSDESEDELLDWMEHAFFQFTKLELFLGCDEQPGRAAACEPGGIAVSGRRRQRSARRRADARPEVAMDAPGNAIIAMLQKAGGRLAAAEARIGRLLSEVDSAQERAAHAETWLQLLESEIVDKLVAPTADRSR